MLPVSEGSAGEVPAASCDAGGTGRLPVSFTGAGDAPAASGGLCSKNCNRSPKVRIGALPAFISSVIGTKGFGAASAAAACPGRATAAAVWKMAGRVAVGGGSAVDRSARRLACAAGPGARRLTPAARRLVPAAHPAVWLAGDRAAGDRRDRLHANLPVRHRPTVRLVSGVVDARCPAAPSSATPAAAPCPPPAPTP